MKKLCYALLIGFTAVSGANAQEMESKIPIIKADVQKEHIMFERMVWRRMDLREKQNAPFFSINGELSTLLIQGVKDGLIKPYMTDSVKTIMPDSIFESNISVEVQGGGFDAGGFGGGFGGCFGNETSTQQSSGPQRDPIPPSVIDVVYLRERVLFDRNRSRMYWYIQSVSLYLPGRAGSVYNPAGFEKMIANFKYEDVINLFRGPYADKAVWYNNQNQAQHRNYGDAFELRLFSAPITKMSNAQNLDIRQQTTDPYEAVMLQQKMEYDLMEYESELWEY